MNATPVIIGIDLGTTYSACAVWQDGEVRLAPNALGELLTPSAVGLDDDGTVLVGRTARERLISHPDRTTAFFKRVMGTSGDVHLDPRGKVFTPTELSALVLRALKEDAERLLGSPVTHAVISVPAYFNQAQRQATREAGQLAGLKVNRLVNEPTAAAIAHGLNEAQERRFMVLDLGGGTFDVSILEYFDGVLEVHATAGDSALGGEDFNDAVLRRFAEEHALGELSAEERQRLYARVETAKRCMRRHEPGEIVFARGVDHYTTLLDEAYLTDAAAPLLVRIRSAMERALSDAGMSPDEIEDVILVGGSSRLGVFRTMVGKLFGRMPRADADPDLTVARGAALQAALVARDAALEDIVLTDVCPFSLGIAALEEGTPPGNAPVFHPILERNTIVPASRVEEFFTVADNQEVISVDIYQGESRRLRDNLLLGSLQVGVRRGPAGSQSIAVRLSYDVNGLLEVDVRVNDTGEERRVVIENAPGALSEKEKRKSAGRLARLKVLPEDLMEVRAITARADRLYASLLGDERRAVGELMAAFERVLARQDPQEIRRALAAYEEALSRVDRDLWR